MTKKQKRNSIASIGTVLFMGFVLLLLWLLRLDANITVPETYIEIELGEPEELDMEEEKIEEVPTPKTGDEPAEGTPANQVEEPQQVVEEEEPKVETPIVSEKPSEVVEPKKEGPDSTEIKKQQQANDISNFVGGLNFNEEAPDDGPGKNPENPIDKGEDYVGGGNDGDNKWSLKGGDLVGKLPKPSTNFGQEGKVVIQIKVNAAGVVVEAKETTGGQVSDKQTVNLAIEAAKKAKFTPGTDGRTGTIEYIFKLN